jgi:hypothetical protein
MNRGRLRTTIAHFDAYADVFRARLGILNKDVKIALGIEDARVEQFILHLLIPQLPTLLNELLIGIGLVGIFIQILHVGMRWRRVEVEIIFLHIFAVIGLRWDQAKQPLFQNRIFAVPQRQGKRQDLVAVTDTGKPILTPTVRFRTGEIMRKIIPGVPIGTIILSHRPPRALGDVGAPVVPRADRARKRFLETLVLGRHHILRCSHNYAPVVWYI